MVAGEGWGGRRGDGKFRNVYKKKKMVFFEGCPAGGGTHRSWPGGWGGRPRALIPGEGLCWAGLVDGGLREWARAWGGGARASVPGLSDRGVRDGAKCVVFLSKGSGVRLGGYPAELAWCRDTGPRNGANFATCVVFLSFLMRTKRRKMAFFEGCPVGCGGGTHRSWPGGRGGRPGAWLQERVDGSSKEGEDALWWGVPTGAGLVDGGVGQGP